MKRITYCRVYVYTVKRFNLFIWQSLYSIFKLLLTLTKTVLYRYYIIVFNKYRRIHFFFKCIFVLQKTFLNRQIFVVMKFFEIRYLTLPAFRQFCLCCWHDSRMSSWYNVDLLCNLNKCCRCWRLVVAGSPARDLVPHTVLDRPQRTESHKWPCRNPLRESQHFRVYSVYVVVLVQMQFVVIILLTL